MPKTNGDMPTEIAIMTIEQVKQAQQDRASREEYHRLLDARDEAQRKLEAYNAFGQWLTQRELELLVASRKDR